MRHILRAISAVIYWFAYMFIIISVDDTFVKVIATAAFFGVLMILLIHNVANEERSLNDEYNGDKTHEDIF